MTRQQVEQPWHILTASEALLQAAKANRRAIITLENACAAGEPEGCYYDSGLLTQAAELSQVAMSLMSYAATAGKWQAR